MVIFCNIPWFRLTPEAVEIDREEKKAVEDCREDLKDRLKRFIFMSKRKVFPLNIIQGMQWYLCLPEDFLRCLEVSKRKVSLYSVISTLCKLIKPLLQMWRATKIDSLCKLHQLVFLQNLP